MQKILRLGRKKCYITVQIILLCLLLAPCAVANENYENRSKELYLRQMELTVELQQASLNRMKEEDKVNLDILESQLLYYPIILGIVSLVVATGLWFSYLQVRKTSGDSSQYSSLEITKEGIRVRSPVIGLLILTLSLGFFYLYLTEVYRITRLE